MFDELMPTSDAQESIENGNPASVTVVSEQETGTGPPAQKYELQKLRTGICAYTWGQGALGQLGHGDESDLSEPRHILALTGSQVVLAAAGNQHSSMLLDDGTMRTFGRSNFGQLGLGTTMNTGTQNVPRPIMSLERHRVTNISCGWYHSALVTDDGNIYTFGAGEYGRLGHGDEANQAEPTLVKALEGKNISMVSCGGFHTCAITKAGAVYSWGGGYFGQLGHGDDRERRQPRLVKSLKGVIAVQVACGTHHTGILSDAGEVYTWGSGEFGKLGHGDDTSKQVPSVVESLRGSVVRWLACGGFHSAAVLDNGEAWTWGSGDKGQLGHGDLKNKWLPRLVDSLRDIKLVHVACGTHHTAACAETGEVFTWGAGEFGRLGLGDDDKGSTIPRQVAMLAGQKIVSVACGSFHTIAVSENAPVPVESRPPPTHSLHHMLDAGDNAAFRTTSGPVSDPIEGYIDIPHNLSRSSTKRAGVAKPAHRTHGANAEGDMSDRQRAEELEEEVHALKKLLNKARVELGQRTEDCERLRMDISRLEGDDMAYLSMDGLEELEHTYYQGLERISAAKTRTIVAETDTKLDDVQQMLLTLGRDHQTLESKITDDMREMRAALLTLKQDQNRLRVTLLKRVSGSEQAMQELAVRLSQTESFATYLHDIMKSQGGHGDWDQAVGRTSVDVAMLDDYVRSRPKQHKSMEKPQSLTNVPSSASGDSIGTPQEQEAGG